MMGLSFCDSLYHMQACNDSGCMLHMPALTAVTLGKDTEGACECCRVKIESLVRIYMPIVAVRFEAVCAGLTISLP